MFDRFDDFDAALPRSTVTSAAPQPLRRRKSLKQRLVFTFVNWLLVTPFVLVLSVIFVADGLRTQFSLLSLRLSKFPIPGAHFADRVEGLHRADAAVFTAIGLYFLTNAIYTCLFVEALGEGPIAAKCKGSLIVPYVLLAIAFVVCGLDLVVFYAGLSSKIANSWTTAPPYAAPAATALYGCSLALIGFWHADHKTLTN